jgi:tRNA-splicing ligase RtcB
MDRIFLKRRRKMNKFQIESDGNKGIPIFSWCEDIEESALAQIANLAHLPFAYHHIAVMPDCHSGYGMPIGGVLATKGVIIPNAVGVDINCSVSALKTNIKASDLSVEKIKDIMGEIRKRVPFGEGQYPECDKEISEYLEGLEKELLLEGCAI